MSRLLKSCSAILLVLAWPLVVWACLWDYDTLQMERQRFPNTLELITGKFLRHSPEFYQWRITDRLARLEKEPENLALYDDLAVAYDKTGQHDLAVETILKKERLAPGKYETEANLGTFLIHGGKLTEGLVHIQKAIDINPDAHFGREKYQQLLVEYVLSRQADGQTPQPLADIEWSGPAHEQYLLSKVNFATFLQAKTAGQSSDEDRAAAIKGVLGIMKFGNFESPIVLEALGDLLAVRETGNDAKQLAARAYLKAEMAVSDPEAKRTYRALAKNALEMQTVGDSDREMPLTDLVQQFQIELAEANTWYDQLHAQELQWIREGKNADAEFDRLYTSEPSVMSRPHAIDRNNYVSFSPIALTHDSFLLKTLLMIVPITFGTLAIAVVLGVFIWRRRARKPKTKSASPYV